MIDTAAGSRVFIATTAPATTQGEFEAESYVEVGEVEDLGEFGDSAEEVTFTALGDRRVRKLKGAFNAGTMAVKCGHDSSDDGQAAMLAAQASDLDYNFKVVLDDQITVGGTPTIAYFRGKVMSSPRSIGNASNVVRRTFNVGINSAILDVAAT